MKKRKEPSSTSASSHKKLKVPVSKNTSQWKVSGYETPDEDEVEDTPPTPPPPPKPEQKSKSKLIVSAPVIVPTPVEDPEVEPEEEEEEEPEIDDDDGVGSDDDGKASDLSVPAPVPARPKVWRWLFSLQSAPNPSGGGLKPCMYGAKCYRKNPDHFKEFSHPSTVPASPSSSSASPVAAAAAPAFKKDGIRHCRRKECVKPCGLHVQTLAKTSKEYLEIESLLNSSNVHAYKYPTLQRIKKVTHDVLDARLRASCGASKTTLMWHGTKYGFATSILHTGFQLPKNPGMFGKGLYFATDSSKSWQYSLKHFANVVLLCDVAVGNTLVVDDANYNIDLAHVTKKGFQSTWAKAGTCVLYNEYVVYTTEQAVVRYIVEFERSDDDKKGTRKVLPPCPFPGCYDVSPAHTGMYAH